METEVTQHLFMSAEIKDIAMALAKAQGAMPEAKMDAQNPHLKNKYASLASVWEAIREPMSSNNLAITQLVESTDGEGVAVRTLLVHGDSGQWYMSLVGLPKLEGAGTNLAQKLGSAISYLKRYALQGITGCVSRGEDDDAASAPDKAKGQPPKKEAAKKPEGTTAEQNAAVKELTQKVLDTKALPHLENLYKKHKPEIDKLPAKVASDMKKLFGEQKAKLQAELSSPTPEDDPTMAPDYEPPIEDPEGGENV